MVQNLVFLLFPWTKKKITAGITILKRNVSVFLQLAYTKDCKIDVTFDYFRVLPKVFRVLRRRVSQFPNKVFERFLINNFSFASV